MIISVFHTVENIVGKGENAGYQHVFPFSHNVLKRHLSQTRQKVSLCGNRLRGKHKQQSLLIPVNQQQHKKNTCMFSIMVQYWNKS